MNNYNHVYLKMHEIIYLHPNHLAKLVPLSFISTKSNRARAYYIREVLCSVLGLGYSTLREKERYQDHNVSSQTIARGKIKFT